MNPAALLRAFMEDLRQRQLSKCTLVQREQGVARFLRYLVKKRVRDVRRLGEDDVVGYVRLLAGYRTKRGTILTVNSQVSYAVSMRSFCAFLERRKLVLQDPSRDVRLPAYENLPRALGEQAMRRLLNVPDPRTAQGCRDRALLELLYGTGLRLRECVRLDLIDIDLRGGTLLVRDGKGRKDRLVPLCGRAHAALDAYLRLSRPVLLGEHASLALFVVRGGRRRLGYGSVGLLVRRYAARVGLRASPHMLRHSCATHLLKGGADVREVQVLLGHARIDTTTLYTAVAIEDLRAVMKRAHPRGRR